MVAQVGRRRSGLLGDEPALTGRRRVHACMCMGLPAGVGPWGVGDGGSDEAELGSVFRIQCDELWDAQPGSGTLRVTGEPSMVAWWGEGGGGPWQQHVPRVERERHSPGW